MLKRLCGYPVVFTTSYLQPGDYIAFLPHCGIFVGDFGMFGVFGDEVMVAMMVGESDGIWWITLEMPKTQQSRP